MLIVTNAIKPIKCRYGSAGVGSRRQENIRICSYLALPRTDEKRPRDETHHVNRYFGEMSGAHSISGGGLGVVWVEKLRRILTKSNRRVPGAKLIFLARGGRRRGADYPQAPPCPFVSRPLITGRQRYLHGGSKERSPSPTSSCIVLLCGHHEKRSRRSCQRLPKTKTR